MQHTFRATQEDEKVINALCAHLGISLADVIRIGVRCLAHSHGLISFKKKVVEIENYEKEVMRVEAQL